jgi:hypothetical protein
MKQSLPRRYHLPRILFPTMLALAGASFLFGFAGPVRAACTAKMSGYACSEADPSGENQIDLFVTNPTYWQSRITVPPGDSCSGCTVTLSTELCKAAAKHSMDFDEEMGITVSEGPDEWQCVTSRSNCDKQGNVSTELFSAQLFGNVNSGSPCPKGQYCCVPKAPESTAAASAGTSKTLPDPLGGANIHSIIGSVIRTFAGIAGSIALIMFVYGGIMMIISRGESDKVKGARTILINSTIGIVLIFSAYTFVAAIIDAILAE